MSEIISEKTIVSACLMGLCTRYDAKINDSIFSHTTLYRSSLIPVCPEQLGGLPTPRPPADIVGGNGNDVLSGKAKVLSKDGEDFTEPFIKGAHEALKLAQSLGCSSAILKARSPSCGVNAVLGVTAALLQQNGISVKEADLPK